MANNVGDGSGSDSGYGDGSGSGSGYGDGEDAENYFRACIQPDTYPPEAQIAFWRSMADGRPANGGVGEARTVGMDETISGPLRICTPNALHATTDPKKHKGERWWLVALYPPIQTQDDKIGSLRRVILKDLGKCPF